MRLKKFTATLAASALAFGLTAGVAQAEPQQPIKVDSQGVVTGSHIQNLYSHMGKYKTVSTMKAQDCGLVYKIYAKILEKDHNNKMKHTCWGTFPDGAKKPADVQFVYPENIAELGKLPVIIYTPGIGAEAGLTEHLYHMWASHGYIVVVTYTFLNWTGYTDVQGAASLFAESQNSKSPLFGHVDATKTILTGHSAGGGSTESGSSWLLPQVEKKYPGLKVVAAVPLQPGPSVGFQPLLSKVPTFYLTGEKDTVCFDWSIRPRYKMNKNVPAWIAMVKGAPHGQEMDDWRNSAFAASVLAFADLYLNNTENARQIFFGPNYFLAKDAAFMKVERNDKAAALK